MEHVPGRGEATVQSKRLLLLLRRHPLFFYFLIAYVVTWGIGLLWIALWHHEQPFVEWLMGSGPIVSAFIMAAATEGKAGIGRLSRRLVLWRVGVPWYLLILIAIPVLQLLTLLILPAGQAFVRYWLALLPVYPVSFIGILFLGGPFCEEPGWRGFALPRLQLRYGPLRGTLLLGVLWTFWHLPLFFIPGFNGAGTDVAGISLAMAAFLVGALALAVVFTWVFNNTRGSVLLAILLHTSIDAASPSTGSLPLHLVFYALYIVVALLIIVATRGHLSYERYLDQKQTSLQFGGGAPSHGS